MARETKGGVEITEITARILEKLYRGPVVFATIFGFMGRGKSNICYLIARDLEQLGWEVRFLEKPNLEQVRAAVTEPVKKSDSLLIIFDDFSFIMSTRRTKQIDAVLNEVTATRHSTGARNTITIMAVHDLTAVLPFLRSTQVHIFTSMTAGLIERVHYEFAYPKRKLRLFNKTQRLGKALYCDAELGACEVIEGIPKATTKPPAWNTSVCEEEVVCIPRSEYEALTRIAKRSFKAREKGMIVQMGNGYFIRKNGSSHLLFRKDEEEVLAPTVLQ